MWGSERQGLTTVDSVDNCRRVRSVAHRPTSVTERPATGRIFTKGVRAIGHSDDARTTHADLMFARAVTTTHSRGRLGARAALAMTLTAPPAIAADLPNPLALWHLDSIDGNTTLTPRAAATPATC